MLKLPVNANDPSGKIVEIPAGPDQARLIQLAESTFAQLQATDIGQRVLNYVLGGNDLIELSLNNQGINRSQFNTVTLDLNRPIPTIAQDILSGEFSIRYLSNERVLGHEFAHRIGLGDVGPGRLGLINIFENPIFGPVDGYNRLTYGTDFSLTPRSLNSGEAAPLINQLSTFPSPIRAPRNNAADGGFVIYPNKSNNNQLRGIYQK